jgi:hypothetical protein
MAITHGHISLLGTALLHGVRYRKMTRHVPSPVTEPALDLKTHFGNCFRIPAVNDSRDRYVSMAIGTREDQRVQVVRGHERQAAQDRTLIPSRTTDNSSGPRVG